MNPKRGELYNLKPSELYPKARPIVIVSRDEINRGHSVIAIPFYSQQLEKRSQLDWCARYDAGEGGLEKDCVAKTDEISMLPKTEIDLASGPIGKFNVDQMDRLINALDWSLGIF